ncbi:amino acid adenylation domain-containing protein [Hazenella sp. IB182353]|uniref:non-ribosomal peptide synthetase n=1 Tax=Polycladospora coralii TaxID=2771432 RepID=UPI001745D881|nr:non-ribosomal peptide synthetase [Polycladospora coralii]MBS7531084.1 amino acid adenylation domain-containing protein [Polycladospora coralii]
MSDFELYESSSAQKRIYLVNQLHGIHTTYNLPFVMIVEGKLNKSRLSTAVTQLIQRHETLRTSFVEEKGEVLQKVYEYLDVSVIDRGTVTKDQIDDLVQAFIRPFDLQSAPLFRIELAELSFDKHILMMDVHHIIADGTSMQTIFEEIMAVYNGAELPELDVQYVDFAIWQNDFFQTEVMKTQEAFWMDTFAEEIPILDLPLDFPRPPVQSFNGDKYSFTLDADLTSKIHQFTRQEGITLYMFLLAVYNLFMYRYSGQERIIIGSPIAGRKHVEFEKMIGMFVNTLAMLNEPKGEKSFRSFLQEVKENALQAYENQDFQFEELVRKLDIPRNSGRHPIFDTMLVLQNTDKTAIEMDGLTFTPYQIKCKTTKFDLLVEVFDHENELKINFEYNTGLFQKETIQRMATHFSNLVQNTLMNPENKLFEYEMISEVEKQKILFDFNDTQFDYPREKSITQLFEEQVEKKANHIALIYQDHTLTYQELNNRSNQLARALRKKGIKSGEVIGLITDRSIEMIISILAILKAGGVYLPIEPNQPEKRIHYMLEDSSVNLLLVQREGMIPNRYSGEILRLDEKDWTKELTDNLLIMIQPQDLAYVIYTSGSTGKPKGSLNTHQNVIKTINNGVISVDETDRILQLANYAFDGSTYEIYTALLQGAPLVLVPKEALLNTVEITRLIRKHKITSTCMTTSLFNTIVDLDTDCLRGMRKLLFGGEKASVKHVQKALNVMGAHRLINAYGPTETTVFATLYSVDDRAMNMNTIPIGYPVHNTTVYILGDHNQLQPIGVPGELCIGGEGLAKCYLNRPELTEERFVMNPYTQERMYRTGDLVRWLPDGNIEYFDRIDSQVKIRGNRIELDEIEIKLLEHAAICETVLVARTDEGGHSYLCCYLVTNGDWTVSELRDHLKCSLPEYMIPSYFVELEKLPLTSSGKLDKKSLPEPNGNLEMHEAYQAPTNRVENMLVQIFEEILGVRSVGIHDNFFELGGHSLKATKLVAHVHKKLEVELPIQEVFAHPTVKEMAMYIRNAEENPYASIQPIKKQEHYALSPAQKRMYIMNQMDPSSTVFNITDTMMVKGKLDYEWFENVFKQMIERHESLRTSISLREGEPVQIVHDEIPFQIDIMEEEWESINDNLIKRFIRPFDLHKAPLIRVGLIKVDSDTHLFILDIHHIVVDGTSIGILSDEFVRLCRGEALRPLRIQYKDFVAWQNDILQSEITKKQEIYWLDQFHGDIPVLQLPTDYPRKMDVDYKGDSVQRVWNKDQLEFLKRFSRKNGTTLFITLLTAYNILLHKYTAQDDIVVGTPIAGRQHIDLENIVGMFVNTLAIRNYPRADKTVRELIKEVKENVFKAYENQGYPLEELVAKLGTYRDVSRNPLFDTMLVIQNMDIPDIQVDHLQFQPYQRGTGTSQGDLTWIVNEKADSLSIEVEYRANLFKRETIEAMVQDFFTVLQKMEENMDELIVDLSIREKKIVREVEWLAALEDDFVLF